MKILEILTKKRAIGNIGEKSAAEFLKKSGYKILKRNYVALGNEIDIIAFKDNTYIFVEVKARTESRISEHQPRPASAVTPDKQQKILKAAAYFRAGGKREGRMRFDVIEVYLDDSGKPTRINHLKNTFDKDTAYRFPYGVKHNE